MSFSFLKQVHLVIFLARTGTNFHFTCQNRYTSLSLLEHTHLFSFLPENGVHFHLPCWQKFTSSLPLLEHVQLSTLFTETVAPSHFPCLQMCIVSFLLLGQIHFLTLLTEINASSHYHCWNSPFWNRHTFSRFFLKHIHTFISFGGTNVPSSFLTGTGSHFILYSRSGTHLHFLTKQLYVLSLFVGTYAHFNFPCQKRWTFLLSLLGQVHFLCFLAETGM